MQSLRSENLRVDAFQDLAALPPDVQDLFASAEHEELQAGLDWLRNLVSTVFGTGASWRLYVLRREGLAVAALPTLIEDNRLLGATLRSLGNFYTTLFSPPLHPSLHASELAFLLASLRKLHGPLHSLRFAPLDPASSTARTLLEGLRLACYQTYEYECFGNWYLPVSGNGADYLASRPGEVRSTLRRTGKKFASQGGRLEIVDLVTPERIAAFVHVYGKSWKQPEPFPDFIPGLIRLCSDRGWLRLGLAWIDEQPVAAQLWMVASRRASIYKLAYDPAFKHLSPGSLLTAALMRHVIDQDDVAEVDYLSGDDAYKQAWVSHRRVRSGIVAYNLSSPGGLFAASVESLRRLLKPVIKRVISPA